MQALIDIHELSRLLGRAVQTIRNDLARNPLAVPPSIRIPGTRLRRWRPEAVELWVEQATTQGTAQKRGRGRPRKFPGTTAAMSTYIKF